MFCHTPSALDSNAGSGGHTGIYYPRCPIDHKQQLAWSSQWYWGGGIVLESQPPSVGEWHHCVYTFDSQIHRLYLNSQDIWQSAVIPQVGKPDMLMFGNYPGGHQYFKG